MKHTVAIVAALLALAPAVDAANAATPVVIGKRMIIDSDGPLKQQAISRPERDTTSTSGVDLKEFFLTYGGVFNVSWQYRGSDGANATVTIITNKSQATECELSTSSATYTAANCSLEVSAGTLLQVRLKSSNGEPVFIRNVKLNFELEDVTAPAVLTNDGAE